MISWTSRRPNITRRLTYDYARTRLHHHADQRLAAHIQRDQAWHRAGALATMWHTVAPYMNIAQQYVRLVLKSASFLIRALVS